MPDEGGITADGEFRRLLELARTSAQALRGAGVPPDRPAPSLAGWLAIERLDSTETIFAPKKGGKPRRETTTYVQIWLTTDGGLCSALRTHGEYCHWIGDQPTGDNIPDSDSIEPRESIVSPGDISFRWDGYYGPSVQTRNRANETIVQGKPFGPRENPSTRIAAALAAATASRISLHRPASPEARPVSAVEAKVGGAERKPGAGPALAPLGRAEPSKRTWGDMLHPLPVVGALGLALAAVWWSINHPADAIGMLLWVTPILIVLAAIGLIVVCFSDGFVAGLGGILGAFVAAFVLWLCYSGCVGIWKTVAHTSRHCPPVVGSLPAGKPLCDAGNHQPWGPPLFHFSS